MRQRQEYEFANGLYRNAREMCDAIAETWLCADGANSRETMLEILADEPDEHLTDECMAGWFSDTGDEDGEIRDDFDRDDLLAAFTRLRREFDARFPAEENPVDHHA